MYSNNNTEDRRENRKCTIASFLNYTRSSRIRRKTEMNIENFRANTKIPLFRINLQKNNCLLNNVSFQSFVNVQKHNWFLYIDFVPTTLWICLLLLTIFGGLQGFLYIIPVFSKQTIFKYLEILQVYFCYWFLFNSTTAIEYVERSRGLAKNNRPWADLCWRSLASENLF